MKSKFFHLKLSDIESARQSLAQLLEPTPLLRNQWLSESLGFELFLKLENMQPIGSFKIRGATYKISRLSREMRRKGVICASAGNHAQGVAWGSQQLGVKATIVMPHTAPLVKVQNTKALGAKIVLAGKNYDEAFAAAKKLASSTGQVYVHAFEDPDVIAGQGTIGLEILDQLPDVDTIIGSMGGGGMMAGVGLAVKEKRPQTKIWGCQASGAPSIVESVKKGRAIKLDKVDTFADGIAVAEAKVRMIKVLRDYVDEFHLADDEAIAASILMLLEKAKVVAEGSGAIPLSVADRLRKRLKGQKVVLIVSGGNVDVNVLGRVIERGLIKAGRRVKVNVLISDIPGSLSRLTGVLADQGVNILQAIHDRNELSTGLAQTEVEFILETKGPEHTESVLETLRTQAARVEVLHR